MLAGVLTLRDIILCLTPDNFTYQGEQGQISPAGYQAIARWAPSFVQRYKVYDQYLVCFGKLWLA